MNAAGITRALLNTHHHAGQVRDYIAQVNARGGVELIEAYEPELLGSAGTVHANRDWAEGADEIVVIYADNLSDIDLGKLVAFHRAHDDPMTMALFRTDYPEKCGIATLDATGRITDFVEKPAEPPTMPGAPGLSLASMGIYVFDWKFLRGLLIEDAENPDSSHDFGKDLIPQIVKNGKAMAHRFADSCVTDHPDAPAYWRDVGTIDAFWQANIDLTNFTPELNLWDRNWPIWTYSETLPPAKFIHDEKDRRGSAVSSMVSGGCIISGAEVRNSLLFNMCRANSYSVLDHAVLMPEVEIGRHARLKNVVIDRGVEIPPGLVVGEDPEEDARWFRVTEGGVTLITAKMLARRAQA